MMDLLIIKTVFGELILYILMQAVIFRIVKPKEVIKWLVYDFLLVSAVILSITGFNIFHKIAFLSSYGFTEIIFAFFISMLLFGLASLIYILRVFGVVAASMRIQLLETIYEAGNKGLPHNKLLKLFNRDKLLKKRLNRFISSGEIKYKNNSYVLNKRFSMASIPFIYFNMIWKLYAGEKTAK